MRTCLFGASRSGRHHGRRREKQSEALHKDRSESYRGCTNLLGFDVNFASAAAAAIVVVVMIYQESSKSFTRIVQCTHLDTVMDIGPLLIDTAQLCERLKFGGWVYFQGK